MKRNSLLHACAMVRAFFANNSIVKHFAALKFLALTMLAVTNVQAQTTFSWRNDQNPTSGQWNVSTYWWNGSAAALPGGGEILFLDGTVGTTMTNDLPSTNRHKITFGSTNTPAARTIGGTSTNTFFEFGTTWPRIQNDATNVTHTINFPMAASTNAGFNLELVSNAGPLVFGGTLNNNGRTIQVYGNNTAVDGTNRFVRLGGVVSGTGALNVSQFGVARLNAAHTYTGQTQIDNGEMWIESSGSIASGSSIFVGNGGQLANVAKLWLSNSTGGTTFSNAVTINNGNTTTRYLGGLNTSGTHTFSGNITNNSAGGLYLSAVNSGGTTAFSGVISGSNPVLTDGSGTVTISGTGANTYTGATTIGANLTVLNKTAGVAAIPTATTINTGVTLRTDAANQWGTGGVPLVTINGSGTFNLNGNNQKVALASSSSTATVTLGAGTLNIDNTGTDTYAGVISGTGGINKTNTGTQVLSNTGNSYTGTTTVTGGTLRLGAANVIPNSSNIILAGGTLSTGATTGNAETMGTLQLTASSTLALGTGVHNVVFANSSAVSWTSGTILTITGWTGTNNGNSPGTAGKVFIGNSFGGLTGIQLSRIRFSISSVLYGAMQLSTGEIVPSGGTVLYYGGATGTWTGSVWGTSESGPFATAWTSGAHAIFNTASANTLTFATTNVAAVTYNANITYTAGGTWGTGPAGGTICPIYVDAGTTFTMGAQGISTTAGSGIIKLGTGTWQGANGNAYTGGFTINAGMFAAGGVNSMGAGGTLTINGGTIAGTANRSFTGKFTSITIGGDFTLGSTSAPASSTATLLFDAATALGSSVTRTITLGGTGVISWNGAMSGTGSSLVVNATTTGTLSLGAANTYTGSTTIGSSATVRLGIANAIPVGNPGGGVVLNGGTLSSGSGAGFSDGTSGTNNMGTLNLAASSTIALGTGSHSLYFAASNGVTWNGTTLTITGWTGSGGASGTAGKIFFGAATGTLTAAQLAKISFTGYSGTPILLSTGELVPMALPTVATTVAASSIATTSASTGGQTITGTSLTAKGVAYSTAAVSTSPTISNSVLTDGATTTADFTSNLTGLSPETQYYVRAYATNAAGTGYGPAINFFTFSNPATAQATGLSATASAAGILSVSWTGATWPSSGATKAGYALIYSTSTPTLSSTNGTAPAAGVGTLLTISPTGLPTAPATSQLIGGLTGGTTYNILLVPFTWDGVNAATYNYLTTSAPTTSAMAIGNPSITTTTAASSITNTGASSGGSSISANGGTISAKGVVWNTSTAPTTANSSTNDGGGTTSFSSSISSLNAQTLYYVRAYVTNNVGTAYGNEVTFRTLSDPATAQASSLSGTASASGSIALNWTGATFPSSGATQGGYALIYSSSTPTLSSANGSAPAAGVGTLVTITPTNLPTAPATSYVLNGLTGGTTYNFLLVPFTYDGTNAATYNYLTASAPTTSVLAVTTASVTTTAASSITNASASSGGSAISAGGGSISARGVVWDISTAPTTSNSLTTDGTGTSLFSSSLTSLSAQTLYYYRAYVTNELGTVYGSESSFRTLSNPATAQATGLSVSNSASGELTISWTGATFPASGATKGGYALIYSTGTPTLSSANGAAPAAGVGTLVTITPTNLPTAPATSYVLSGLTGGTVYNFLLVPFTWDGTNAATYNYLTTSAPTASATAVSTASVTTTAVSAITSSSASSGGSAINSGGGTVSAKGVVWNTSTAPTTANSSTNDGAGTGDFSSSLTSLSAQTLYYYRAYVTNDIGTVYGSESSFYTLSNEPTAAATSFTATANGSSQIDLAWTAATFPGAGASNNGYVILRRVDSTNPTTSGVVDGVNPSSLSLPSGTTLVTTITSGATASFSHTSLFASTQYNYIIIPFTWDGTNAATYNYYLTSAPTANDTTAAGLPSVDVTTAASSITHNSASSGGSTLVAGGSAITAKGVAYNTTGTPTISDNTTSDGSGTADFSSSLTGLSGQTVYYVRAYVTNNAGTAYGNEINFRTLSNPATAQASGLTATASASGELTINWTGATFPSSGATQGGYALIYSTGTPTLSSTNASAPAAGTGTLVTITPTNLPTAPATSYVLTGLTAGTTYNFLLVPFTWNGTNANTYNYLTASAPTASGTAVSPASVTTTAISAITVSSASSGGSSIATGGGTISAKGVVWNTSTAPTTANSSTNDGTGTTSYSSSLTSLSAQTLYYTRAYVTNEIGTVYGNELSFRTLSNPATAQASGLSATASASGELTINWTGATFPGSGATQGGYALIYSTGTPTLSSANGAIPAAGVGTLVTITPTNLPSAPAASYVLSGLTGGTTYNFLLVPFTWDGTNATTYNYLTTSAPTASAAAVATASLTTTAASAITNTTASSGGSAVNAGGGTISAKGVVWNTATAPTTANSSTNDGTGTASYSSSLTSLSPQTLYYARAYATNDIGTAYGNEVTFRTLSNPPTAQATGLTATASSSSNINLSWSAATFPVSGATTTGYVLLRATSPNTPSLGNSNGTAPTAGANTTIVSSTLTGTSTSSAGLTAATTYNYLLVPFTWDGVNTATYNYLTASAPTATGTTLAATPSAQPSSLVFSAVTSSTITTSWTAVGTPAGYIVLRSAGSAPDTDPVSTTTYTAGNTLGNATVAYVGSAVTTGAQTGLVDGTTYFYEVYSYNGSGSSINYLTTSPLSGSQATTSIAAPVATAATSIADVSFTANWNSSTGAASYQLDVFPLTFDSFENTTTLFTTTTGTAAYYSGNTSATLDAPASAAYATDGTFGVGITNSTLVLTSANINTSSFASPSCSFRLASLSIGSTSNGADATDIITVEVSPDGGNTYYSTARVLGFSNATWSFSTGSGVASTAYDGNATPVDFQPVAGGARAADGYSTITITGLPLSNNLRVRITLFNNAASERWVIDNFSVSPAPGNLSGYNNLSVAGTSQVVTGLSAGSNYGYRVRAVGANSTSVNSNIIAVATLNDPSNADYRSVASGNYTSASTWEYNSIGSTWVAATQAPTSASNVTIQAAHTVTLDANRSIDAGKTLTISGILDAGANNISGAGIVAMGATSTIITSSANGLAGALQVSTPTSSTFAQGAKFQFSGTTVNTGFASFTGITAFTFYNITWSGTTSLTLDRSIRVTTLDLTTNGLIYLGNFDMSISFSGVITGSPFSSSKMIVTDGTGSLIRFISAGTGIPFTWPIGEVTGSAEYSPVNITTLAGNSATNAFIGFRVTDGAEPNNGLASNYLTRYWTYTTGNLTAGSTWSNATFGYTAGDIVGTEASLKVNAFNSATSTWTEFASSSATSNTLTFTSGASTTTVLTGNTITARVDPPLYYRSASSGNWGTAATWLASTDAAFVAPAGVAATSAPTASNSVGITIMAGHSITSSASVSADQLTIQSTGSLEMTNNALTISDGTGTDVTISSGATLLLSGTATITINPGATIQVDGLYKVSSTAAPVVTNAGTTTVTSTGTYEHARDAGIIPNCTWNAGSTCLITGTGNNAPTGLAQSFHHFTVNTTLTNDVNCSGALATINGKFRLTTNSASFGWRLTNTTNYTLTVTDSLIITNGILDLASGASTGTLNANGPIVINGATSQITKTGAATVTANSNSNLIQNAGIIEFNAGGSSNTTWNIKGDFVQGGAVQRTNGGVHTLNFNKASGTQTWTQSTAFGTGAITINIGNSTANTVQLLSNVGLGSSAQAFNVNNGATLNMGPWVLSGTSSVFTLGATGAVKLGNINGIVTAPTASGNVQTSTRTFPATASYFYNGTANQVTGNALPATLTGTGNLNIEAATGIVVSLSANTTVPTLNLISGLFAAGVGQNLTLSNNGVINDTGGDFVTGPAAGTVVASGAAAFNGTSNPYNVYTSGGINFGAQTVTIQNGGTFRINSGGFVNTNAPFYGAGSTLQYWVGATYGRSLEWGATSGRGYPHHVQISNNTTLNPANTGSAQAGTPLRTAGNLTIDSGSAMYMDFGCPTTCNNMTEDLVVVGNLVLTGALSGSQAVGSDIFVGGNWQNDGTGANFFPNNRAVFLNGTGAQTISGTNASFPAFPFLFIDKTAGSVSLSRNVEVSESLTFSAANVANIVTGSNTLFVSKNTTTAIDRQGSGHVVGNLRRSVATGTNTYVFPIGDASAYAPASLALNNVTGAGSITASTADGDHPQIASSGLNASKSVNRYYTLSNTGVTLTNYNPTFTYASADVDAGANTAAFLVGLYNASWSYPTVGALTSTSTQATGISTFGEFAIGECKTPTAFNVTGGGAYCAGGSGLAIGIDGSEAGVSYQLRRNGSDQGTAVTGTGSAISFGNQTQAGSYTIVANSLASSSCSGNMTGSVLVNINPVVNTAVSISTTATTICPGTSVTFTATPQFGGSTPVYQWKVNGSNVGTNSASYSSSTLANGDAVTCEMTSSEACPSPAMATSNSITMNVLPFGTPTLSISAPSGTTICAGDVLSFTSSATFEGSQPTYDWRINGVSAGNDTTFSSFTWVNGDQISCVMTSNYLCANSPTATSNTLTITVVAAPQVDAGTNMTTCGTSPYTFANGASRSNTASTLWTHNGAGSISDASTLNPTYTPAAGDIGTTITFTLTGTGNGPCAAIADNVTLQVTPLTLYYLDGDGDGFGNPLSTPVASCTPVAGRVADNTDCCDSNADINPLGEWWADVDNDGTGSFIYQTGCISGCSGGAQLIPYYPGAHGGEPYTIDCDDNNASTEPGNAEICGNLVDDNCNVTIDEGCSGIANDGFAYSQLLNVNTTNAYYPNCQAFAGSVLNADISAEGNPSNVSSTVGAGRDSWYRFVAPTTAAQIKVVPTGFNAVIELRTAAHPAGQIDVENANSAVGGTEIMNVSGLTVGQTYYVAVRNFDATAGGTFTLCVAPLRPSGCNTAQPVNGLSLCGSFKAIFRGADSYTFNFTGTGGTAPTPFATTSATVNNTTLIMLNTPALALRNGGQYNVRVDANFILFNGVGVADPVITIQGVVCSRTIASAPPMEVLSSQRCTSATLNRSALLRAVTTTGESSACTAIAYNFRFTRVADCAGTPIPGQSSFVVTSSSVFLSLYTAFPNGTYPQPNLGYWKVEIAPVFSYGAMGFGPSQIIQVNNTGSSTMLPEVAHSEERIDEVETIAGVYPNPGNGERVMITTSSEAVITNWSVIDELGRKVEGYRADPIDGMRYELSFEHTLANGLYFISWLENGEVKNARWMVSK